MIRNICFYGRIAASMALEVVGIIYLIGCSNNPTTPNVPVSPTIVSPVNNATAVSTTPTLTWNAIEVATSYRMEVSTSYTFSTTVVDNTTLTMPTITLTTPLVTGTTYYWRVNAKNAGGSSAWSSTYNFTTIVAVPVSPALSIPADAATGIVTVPTLTWGTVTGAATYRVQVSTESGFATTVSDDSTVTTRTKTLTTSLANNAAYFWRVNAKNAGGTSFWSATWRFTTFGFPTDADGNVYHTVTIGTQTWTVENLRTTKYNDGTAIPLVTDGTAWGNLTTPGYCWYLNDSATYNNTYGTLYNWYTVNTGKLAPAGWHIPTDAEWDTLQNYLIIHGYNYDGTTTGDKIAKAMAAQTNWAIDTLDSGVIGNNLSTNNKSGFLALPGGCRGSSGSFSYIGGSGFWWSASEFSASGALFRSLSCDSSLLGSNYYIYESCGFSVRLVKD